MRWPWMSDALGQTPTPDALKGPRRSPWWTACSDVMPATTCCVTAWCAAPGPFRTTSCPATTTTAMGSPRRHRARQEAAAARGAVLHRRLHRADRPGAAPRAAAAVVGAVRGGRSRVCAAATGAQRLRASVSRSLMSALTATSCCSARVRSASIRGCVSFTGKGTKPAA